MCRALPHRPDKRSYRRGYHQCLYLELLFSVVFILYCLVVGNGICALISDNDLVEVYLSGGATDGLYNFLQNIDLDMVAVKFGV